MEQKKVARQQHQAAYEKYEKKKKQLVDALKLKEKKAERATKAPKKRAPPKQGLRAPNRTLPKNKRSCKKPQKRLKQDWKSWR